VENKTKKKTRGKHPGGRPTKKTKAPAKMGRPVKWKTPEDMQPVIDEFFKKCDETEEPYTITGLALSLDLTRQGLIEYENKPDFSYTIKIAKGRCENFAEKRIFSGGNAAGAIFALKNYGWRDKQDIEHSGNINMAIAKDDAGCL